MEKLITIAIKGKTKRDIEEVQTIILSTKDVRYMGEIRLPKKYEKKTCKFLKDSL